MKFPATIILPVLCVLVTTAASAQSTGTVMPVGERTKTIALADELLAQRSGTFAATGEILRDPFEVMMASAPLVENEAAVVQTAPRYNDRQILEAIAPRVYPTGSARIGETDYLLFGQKRLKVGEKLTITYEGSVYLIEITSIERNNFRIRLNSEELVRPIK